MKENKCGLAERHQHDVCDKVICPFNSDATAMHRHMCIQRELWFENAFCRLRTKWDIHESINQFSPTLILVLAQKGSLLCVANFCMHNHKKIVIAIAIEMSGFCRQRCINCCTTFVREQHTHAMPNSQ